MARPNKDRKRVAIWVSRKADEAVGDLAEHIGTSKADVYRQALARGFRELSAERKGSR